MTGMGALPGGGFSIIPGSTPFGGQITPLDSESRSLSGARSVVSPERGGGATSGGQSRWVDGGVGPWAYRGEVEIAAKIAPATVFFKLCMVILRGRFCCFSQQARPAAEHQLGERLIMALVDRLEPHSAIDIG